MASSSSLEAAESCFSPGHVKEDVLVRDINYRLPEQSHSLMQGRQQTHDSSYWNKENIDVICERSLENEKSIALKRLSKRKGFQENKASKPRIVKTTFYKFPRDSDPVDQEHCLKLHREASANVVQKQLLESTVIKPFIKIQNALEKQISSMTRVMQKAHKVEKEFVKSKTDVDELKENFAAINHNKLCEDKLGRVLNEIESLKECCQKKYLSGAMKRGITDTIKCATPMAKQQSSDGFSLPFLKNIAAPETDYLENFSTTLNTPIPRNKPPKPFSLDVEKHRGSKACNLLQEIMQQTQSPNPMTTNISNKGISLSKQAPKDENGCLNQKHLEPSHVRYERLNA